MKRVKQYFQSLSKLQVLGIAVLLIVVSGFGSAAYINSTSSNSQLETLMKCVCGEMPTNDSSETTQTNVTREVECNTRYNSKPVFHLGVLEISKQCSSKEIIVCASDEKVDEYYRDDGCSYEINTVLN